MNITGYKKVNYPHLVGLMNEAKEDSEMQLALAIGIKSAQTIKNAFQCSDQIISDKVLTTLTEKIGINAVVIWEKGVRNYYVKSK